ncbi:hypothetical protein BGX26_004355 [Mortierella sp. AD094]|nr:hypothetical protein BGX26_004355 [Mortierella sp. AD094]
MTVLEETSQDPSKESIRSLYDQLRTHLEEIGNLQAILNILNWDQEVMMPPKAASARAEQAKYRSSFTMSSLAALCHRLEASPELGRIHDELEKRQNIQDLSIELNPYELANIRLSRKAYKEEILYPVEFVKESVSLKSRAVEAWKEAREESNFSKFAPFFEDHIRILRLKVAYKMKGGMCEEARKINKKARASLNLNEDDECYKGYYEALLDDFEPGFKDERLQVIFDDLKKNLIPLIAKIKAKNFQHDNDYFKGEFDVKKQTKFSHRISKEIGFDTDAGRLDVSTDPFTCGIHPLDLRMTTNYVIDNLQKGIMVTIHETGHALYEQGRNKEYAILPVSKTISLGIHESQSLLWERIVGSSKAFWTYALPLLKDHFQEPAHQSLQSATPEKIYNAINRVEPGFIQAGSDGLTHPLHVILRYEIEKALIEGDITVSEVPSLWNAKMKEYLGLEVTDDRLGCLQNIHWAVGAIGYFPTYTLGSMYAVQIFGAAKVAIPNLDEHLAKGEFNLLKKWLNENIHQQGSLRESGDDLVRDLTGKSLDSSQYIQYLTDKYTEIYNL